MTKLDPLLTFFQIARAEGGAEQMRAIADDPSTGLSFAEGAAADDDNPTVRIIVRFKDSLKQLEAAGFQAESVIDDIATGSIPVAQLEELDATEALVQAEASTEVSLSLDNSVPEINADQVHSGPPGRRGNGVVVGLVDSGIDFTHGNFLNASGRTRIHRLWDQNLTPIAGEANPAGFTYGVEYDSTDINSALGAADPFASVRHEDTVAHGSHVAGIAAGDGSLAGNGQPANTYIGVAPESTIVAVATDLQAASIIDGVNYIFRVARDLGMPAVVNLSLGGVIGPHDGTSNYEQGITNLVTGNGRVVVAAAGNEGSDNAHASGTVAAATPTTLTINVPFNRGARMLLDLWYDGTDTFGVTLQDPAGNSTPNVALGGSTSRLLGTDNVTIVHSNSTTGNGDRRILVLVQPPPGGNIATGAWQLQLTGVTINVGTFDTWINNPTRQPIIAFPAAQATALGTVSIPATANRVISVGSYVTRGAGVGSLSTFSNRGPTRDGRPAPDVAAPGERIISAGRLKDTNYRPAAGTSMATPHVTGVVALLLQKNNNYNWQQIRDCLRKTARSDAFTGITPNNAFGWGKVDALAAVRCVRGPFILRTRWPFDPGCGPVFRTRWPFDPGCGPVFRTRWPIDPQCPPFTRDNPRCPVPTRDDPRCPVPTRDDPRCPVPTRDDPRCPVPTRVGPLCPYGGQFDPRRGPRTQGDPRSHEYSEEAAAAQGYYDSFTQAYTQGYRDGYMAAYNDVYGTYDEANRSQSQPNDEETFHLYDESWFDANEFE